MFSPTHTLPLESGSEDDEDSDLPLINIGTPKKPKTGAAANSEATKSLPIHSRFHGDSSDFVSSSQLHEGPPRAFPPAASSSTTTNAFRAPLSGKPPAVSPSALFKTAREEVRTMADGLRNLSPVKVESSRGSSESKRTAKKVRKLARSLKKETDMEKKLEEFRSCNGIQGIAKREEEKLEAQQISCEGSLSEANALFRGGKSLHYPASSEDTSLFSSLSKNPGRSVFVREPSLIVEVYPPGIAVGDRGLLGGLLVGGSGEDLKHIICGVMLPLSYVGRPCPVELTQWLFQLMACSQDRQVSSGALRSLMELLGQSLGQKMSFSAPTLAEIIDVLVTLGAEREKLHPPTSASGTKVHTLPLDREAVKLSNVVGPPSTNLLNLTTYVSACVRALAASYSIQHLEELALVLCSLSLDRHSQLFLRRNLQTCLRHVLAAYPEMVWPKAVARLSPQLVCLSPDHHHHVLLARLLRGTTARELCLLRDFCRLCLVEMVNLPNSHPASLENSGAQEHKRDYSLTGGNSPLGGELTQSKSKGKSTRPRSTDSVKSREPEVNDHSGTFGAVVLQSYLRAMPQKMSPADFHKLHALLQLLNLHGLTFHSQSEKQRFLRVLGTLRSSIRDDPAHPISSQVKDLLIRLSVEMEAQGNRRGGSSTQLDLFFPHDL